MLSGRIARWGIAAAVAAAAGLYIHGLVHDLSLQTTMVRKGLAHIPAMVVENIGVDREFAGVLWKGSIARAERGESGVTLTSIDMTGEWPEGRRIRFSAPEAGYEEARERAVIERISGVIWYAAVSGDTASGDSAAGEPEVRFEAKRALWTNGSREIVFPEGLLVFSPGGTLRGQTARASIDGEFRIEGGAVLTWNDEECIFR